MLPDGPGPEIRTLSNGEKITFRSVPPKDIAKCAESFIKDKVDASKRSEVWYKTLEGLCRPPYTPSWDVPPPNPHEHPETAYSKSRAVSIVV